MVQFIPNFSDKYAVDTEGNVYSYISGTERLLNPDTSSDGRKRVTLYRDGARCRVLVHRLVATIFIPNPHNLPIVNHIDHNPGNNCVGNLEWCTAKHNLLHALNANRLNTVITWDKAKEVRKDYCERKFGIVELQTKYKLSRTEVYSILRNEKWVDLSYDTTAQRKVARDNRGKITIARANKLREDYLNGATRRKLCTEYGIKRSQVDNIVNYKSWLLAE